MTNIEADIAIGQSEEIVDGLRAENERLTKEARINDLIAKQLQRSIEINVHLRTALRKAAERFEAKGMQSDAFEARRVLRDI